MKAFFNWLRGIRSVDAIVASFERTSRQLENAVSYHHARITDHATAAQYHNNRAQAHGAEIERAHRVQTNIRALIQ